MTAAKLATSLRSVSVASASAARAVATSATACLQMPELMHLLPGNCCPVFRQNTCKCQSFVSVNFFVGKIAVNLLFPRAMKAITDDWIALEDEEDEEEGEGEEVMRELFAEEEDDEETDIESDGEAVGEVHELF